MNLPIWAQSRPYCDIRVWWQVLDDRGVDNLGKQSLYCLSQHSEEGYRKANDLVNALIADQDKKTIGRPGPYIHRGVCQARTDLGIHRWDWDGRNSYKGKGEGKDEGKGEGHEPEHQVE